MNKMLLVLLVVPLSAGAQVPSTMVVQGRISTAGGTPYDGSIALKTSLWAEPAGGLDPLWSEAHGTVGIDKGLFQLTLGLTKPLPPSVFASAPIYLEIEVAGEPLPRKALHSVPFAKRSMAAATADTASDLLCTGCVVPESVGFSWAAGAEAGGAALSALSLACDGCVNEAALAFDPATQAELDTHVKTGKHDVVMLSPGAAAPKCDAAHAGALHFDPVKKRVFLCDGQNTLQLLACDPACPAASAVACGESIKSACAEDCGGTGTAINTVQCLTKVATTPCNTPVADGCSNDCGLEGKGLNVAACPAPADVVCSTPVADPCGNPCGGTGAKCPAGEVCGAGGCAAYGKSPANPGQSCKDILAQGGNPTDGLFWVDPTGSDTFQVWCRMGGDYPGATLAIRRPGSVTGQEKVGGDLALPCKPDSSYCKLSDGRINALRDTSTDTDPFIVLSYKNNGTSPFCRSFGRSSCQWISNGPAGAACNNSVSRNSGQYCSRDQTTDSYRGLDGHKCGNLNYPGVNSPNNPFMIFEHAGGDHYCGGWDTSWNRIELLIQ